MRAIKWGKGSLFVYVFKKYRFLLKNTGLWASKYRFVFPEVGMSDIDAAGGGSLTLESDTVMCRGHDPFFRPVGAP